MGTKHTNEEAIEISDLRIALLKLRGEDKSNTIAWRDALEERGEIGRRVAFATFKAKYAK